MSFSVSALAVDGAYGSFKAQVDVSAGSDFGTSLLLQADGKLLMAGSCTDSKGGGFCATRLLANGSYDATFGSAGLGYLSFDEFPGFPASNSLTASALTADGGSIHAGYILSGSTSKGLIIKLTSTGALDTSVAGGQGWLIFQFSNVPITPASFVNAVAVQADGKIVVLGSATRNDAGNIDFGVARFGADLAPDASFGNGGSKLVAFDLDGPSGTGYDLGFALAMQTDGKIVVAGKASFAGVGGDRAAVARLTANGQLDNDPVTGFGLAGRANFDWGSDSEVHAIKVNRDGSILLAGSTTRATLPTASNDFALSRISSGGTVDATFATACPLAPCQAGVAFVNFGYSGKSSDFANAIALQADGKILLVGSARRSDTNGSSYFATTRLGRDGNIDLTYGFGGISGGTFAAGSGIDDSASAIVIGNRGIMIAGYSAEATGTNYRESLETSLARTNGCII